MTQAVWYLDTHHPSAKAGKIGKSEKAWKPEIHTAQQFTSLFFQTLPNNLWSIARKLLSLFFGQQFLFENEQMNSFWIVLFLCNGETKGYNKILYSI